MISELVEYGLSDKEAQTYLSCLKIGKATANRIAEITSMPRSTIYDILERLKSMGLITTIIMDNKTHFIASDPQALLTILDKKKHEVEKILPELNKIHNKIEEKPVAEVYVGKIAVFKVLDEIIENATSLIKILGSAENAIEKLGYRMDRFKNLRIQKGVKVKEILELSDDSIKELEDKTIQVRYLSSFNNVKEAILIVDDFVYHILVQYELSAIKIKSKDHAKMMNIMFDELWEQAKKIKK